MTTIVIPWLRMFVRGGVGLALAVHGLWIHDHLPYSELQSSRNSARSTSPGTRSRTHHQAVSYPHGDC